MFYHDYTGYMFIPMYLLMTHGFAYFVYVNTTKYDNRITIPYWFKQLYNISVSVSSTVIVVNSTKELLKASPTKALCYDSTSYDATYERSLFFYLKFIEWFDTAVLIIKHNGVIGNISNLHYYHHAIVPTMTYYGMHQPGELFVYISNSLAHSLMYTYYAFPSLLKPIKSYITMYQYIQHGCVLSLIVYHFTHPCNINYPFFSMCGYLYFFLEYMSLIYQSFNSSYLYPTLMDVYQHVNSTVISSLLFGLNTLYLIPKNDHIYTLSFGALTLSSVIHHSFKNSLIGNIDKLFAFNIVIQGGMRFFPRIYENLLLSSVVFLAFSGVIVLYIGGLLTESMCFHPNRCIGYRYHSLLHVCSCVGHLCITSLI